MRLRPAFFVLLLGLFLLSLTALPAAAQSSTPGPETPIPDMPPKPPVDRLAPPPTVYPPTQAGDGAQVYYQVCMTCHGDRGQGLTEEWRASLDPADMNCWQSGCHHTRRPPQGFIFPKEVPRVVGGGAMARFGTALDLYQFLQAKMPYQKPGSLTDAEYWQLTAFLLEKNGIPFTGTLDETSAALVRVNAPAKKEVAAPWLPLAASGVALLGLLTAGWVASRRRKQP